MDRLQASRRDNAVFNPQQQQNSYEMTNTNSGFLAEISSIKDSLSQFSRNVQTISALNARLISTIPSSDRGDSYESISQELQSLKDQTRTLSTQIRERIRKLGEEDMSQLGRSELATRKNMITLVRSQFMDALQEYQKVEQESRAKSKEKIERQYRAVNPNATPEELKAVVDSGQTQVFAQAMANSTRYNESRVAYREVQARHEDIKQIEQTLAELLQLFTDMSYIVEQQNDVFIQLEKTTAEVEMNTRKGAQATEQARDYAASARRKRWILFGIFIFVIAVIALALGLKFGLPKNNN